MKRDGSIPSMKRYKLSRGESECSRTFGFTCQHMRMNSHVYRRAQPMAITSNIDTYLGRWMPQLAQSCTRAAITSAPPQVRLGWTQRAKTVGAWQNNSRFAGCWVQRNFEAVKRWLAYKCTQPLGSCTIITPYWLGTASGMSWFDEQDKWKMKRGVCHGLWWAQKIKSAMTS